MEPTPQLSEFGHALIYVLVGIVFVVAGATVSGLLAPHRPNPEKNAPYECGEEPVGSAWLQLNIRFYAMGLIFLVFEVELLLLFPWSVVLADRALIAAAPAWGWFALAEGLLFIGVLAVGLAYVWARGDIDWARPHPIAPTSPNPITAEQYAGFASNSQLLRSPATLSSGS